MMLGIVANQPDDLTLGQSLIGYLLSQQFPDDDSKTVDICLLINFILVPDDLRRHPLIGANSFMFLMFLLLPRQPKITQFDHIPILTDQHVRTLQISMQDALHVMQVHHSFHNFIGDLDLLVFVELLMFFVELVEETPVVEVLRHQNELISCDADTHVEDDVGMFQVTDDHQLLHEVLLMSMSFGLHIVFYCDQLTDVLPLIDFPIPALSDQLQLLDVLLLD